MRCPWADPKYPEYVSYHDTEWGVASHDERKHFEMLILEGAQAGLSWITILKRRDGYRKAFDNFDASKIAKYDARKIASLMKDTGIIRNRLKILSAIQNAKAYLKLKDECGGLDEYLWRWVDGKQIVNKPKTLKDIPAKTQLAEAISKDLKKRGFTFVGPTIIYAHLQAVGVVDDHISNCFCAKRPRKV